LAVAIKSISGKVDPDFNVLENLATLFLGNKDPLANKMMAKTLIGAVARVMKPGTKVDTLTVLQGEQGVLKSTFLKVLAGEAWFCDDIRDLENKDELAKLARYWIIELAEVDYLMGRKEVESFKRFLSITADTYRPPYGRANIRHERTCALFATTNKSEFLKDPTGSRRYWVVGVFGKIDCDLVAKLRDIIWATALAAYERGDTWWLNEADDESRDESNNEYREEDPWEEIILGKWKDLDIKEHKTRKGETLQTVTIENILFNLGFTDDKITKRESNRVGGVLTSLGFENKKFTTKEWVGRAWGKSLNPQVCSEDECEESIFLKDKVLRKYANLCDFRIQSQS
jgi:predicted P-loop ATPase